MEAGEGVPAGTNLDRVCRPRVITHDACRQRSSGAVIEVPSDIAEKRAGALRTVLQDERPEAAPCRALDEAEAAGEVSRVAAGEAVPAAAASGEHRAGCAGGDERRDVHGSEEPRSHWSSL